MIESEGLTLLDPNDPRGRPHAGARKFNLAAKLFLSVCIAFAGLPVLTTWLFIGEVETLLIGSCFFVPLAFTLFSILRKEGTELLQNSNNMLNWSAGGGRGDTALRSMPLMAGRGSRLDRYQSVMFRLRLAPSEGQTVTSLIAQHKRWFNGGEKAARAFFNHPQVVKALDLGDASPTSSGQTKASSTTQKPGQLTTNSIDDSFWGNLEQKATKSVAAADGVCGMARCSNEVNAFSFQCFNCRRRICSSCGNNGVLCPTCASS